MPDEEEAARRAEVVERLTLRKIDERDWQAFRVCLSTAMANELKRRKEAKK